MMLASGDVGKCVTTRRDFLVGVVTAWAFGGCRTAFDGAWDRYSVAVLGDTHFDAEPESVYHAHYDESNRWAAVQHAEFRRNGEMWRGRCRDLLAASARLAHERPTQMILQTGDLVQGDCDHAPTHRKMLDDCIRMLRAPYPKGLPFLTVVGNHDFRGKGAWTHLALTYDGTTLRVYYNGVQKYTKTVTINHGDYKLTISDNAIVHYVDETRVRNAASSADWVKAEYEQGAKEDWLEAAPCEKVVYQGSAVIVK